MLQNHRYHHYYHGYHGYRGYRGYRDYRACCDCLGFGFYCGYYYVDYRYHQYFPLRQAHRYWGGQIPP